MGLFNKKSKMSEEDLIKSEASTQEQYINAKKTDSMTADEAFETAQSLWNQKKYEEANSYYNMAAQQGHTKAIHCLGWSYRFGEGVELDIQKALHYFEKALKGGYIKSGGIIGMIYYYGEGGLDVDVEKAFTYINQAAMAGEGFVMSTLSDMYYRGEGCEENTKLAAYWAYKSIEHKEYDGYYMLGIFFKEGYFFPQCLAESKYCFERAKENGEDVDDFLDDEIYADIEPVEPMIMPFNDSDPSFFTQECPFSQYQHALALLQGVDEEGNTISVNPAAGLKLLELSAEQGYALAQYCLGAKYLNTNEGNGIRYDENGAVLAFGCDNLKAKHYLNLAAEQGHLDALKMMIMLYAIGDIDIQKNVEKSNEYKLLKQKLFQDDDDEEYDDDDEEYGDDDEEYDDDECDDVDYHENDNSELPPVEYQELTTDDGSVYRGETINGKKWGYGKLVYKDGCVYEGEFCKDEFHGKGKYISNKGWVHTGDYHNGHMTGQCKIEYKGGDIYTGTVIDGQWHGFGRYQEVTGSYFEGEYFDGQKDGFGKYVYSVGDVYEGTWHKDKKSGTGRYSSKKGWTYTGDFSDDNMNGQCDIIYANGDGYEGSVKNGLWHGHGVYIHRNGDCYIGEFRDGKRYLGKKSRTNERVSLESLDKIYYMVNTIVLSSIGGDYEGDMVGGIRFGKGKCAFSNGDTYDGIWKNNMFSGIGRYDFADGSWYFGLFEENQMNGYGVFYDGIQYHIGEFVKGRCKTEMDMLQKIGIKGRWLDTTAGDGSNCFTNPDNNSIYILLSPDQSVLFKGEAYGDKVWTAIYNPDTEIMNMGYVDEDKQLSDEHAVVIQVENYVLVGSIKKEKRQGKSTSYLMDGNIFEGVFNNDEVIDVISRIDKFGNKDNA